ncbi:peptidylprolyl isomerase [Bacteroidota bacterium]
MERQNTFLILFLISIFIPLHGQDILMTVGDKEVTLGEFERIYNKNNNNIAANKQSPEEYLELFVNFKLKVLEAESLGMDTTKKFLDEFNKYKEQLAEPYLTDEDAKEMLIKEAYERMQYDVHVSHILISMKPQASPEDTLLRYNRAMEVRQRILDGEDYAAVARATSDDPGARINGGDLGFFTVFMMVYPFETAAYKLADGELSMPVRTLHGYHIIKKHETRPAIGQVKVAHIFIRTPEGMPNDELAAAKSKITAISDSLKDGADFAEMAKRYSDDTNSAVSGGELPWFGTGRMIKEFENMAFLLKNSGELSRPFRTYYGWHIIKLLEKREIGSFEEMLPTLEAKALKGDRDRAKRKRYLDKLKNKYEFQLNEELYKRLYGIVDSTIFYGNWNPYRNTERFDETLFKTQAGDVTLRNFAEHLYSVQRKRTVIPVENYVDLIFNQYLEEILLETEKSTLPDRFPEYKYILQEYHDGILLFDLMDEKVWTKAVLDTTGLESFFAKHRQDYMWDERMEAILVSCDSSIDIVALHKKASNIASGKWDGDELNKRFGTESTESITLTKVVLEKGKNLQVDAMQMKPGTGKVYSEGGKNKFVITTAKVPPSEKELDEIKGQVTSDYQDYLEKQWIEELKLKYKVDVNKELLSTVKGSN